MRDSEKAARGQTIMSETSPDRSTDKADREALHGRPFKGGPQDMSHSLQPDKYAVGKK